MLVLHNEITGADAPEPGSLALTNRRHESFCWLVAEGLTLQDAWIGSAMGRKPKPSASMRVAASNVHARPEVLDRLAYIRRAQASTVPRERLTGARLADIMATVTETLLEAADAAKVAGASHSQQAAIKQAITRHAGRSERFIRKASFPSEASPIDVPFTYLEWCTCCQPTALTKVLLDG